MSDRGITVSSIADWIKQHHVKTGAYPTVNSGQVTLGQVETWAKIDLALQRGESGLPGGKSLASFIDEHFGGRSEA